VYLYISPTFALGAIKQAYIRGWTERFIQFLLTSRCEDMDLDFVRYRHSISVSTLADQLLGQKGGLPAYLASDFESPYRGVIALTSIQLKRNFSFCQC
jgi:hypothetical protein